MTHATYENVYGAPSEELVGDCTGAAQFSPLVPGAAALEDAPAGSLGDMAMVAPHGTIERRAALACALRALRPGARLTALAPKDKGGSRLRGDLEQLGCAVEEFSRRHQRICTAFAPGDPVAVEAAIAAGAPRFVEALGLWSQPGVFSWDRIDPGSALLIEHLPKLSGDGADFGCGVGILARKILAAPKVARLALIDIDRRAVDMARRNVVDARVEASWADVRTLALSGLDFVVMNPPFHDGGVEDRALGQAFIQKAAASLRNGGTLWLTANRHLPYEQIIQPLFKRVTQLAQQNGYKIYQAQK